VVPSTAAGTLLSEDVYRHALALGRTAAGVSGPNPPVGCVIVVDGTIVGEGATAAVGGPHAEVVALGSAGERSAGAIAVVTLEPCAHHGRTGPCSDALQAAGVTEVHVLLRDPDPQAAGGLERLQAAGVTVVDVGTLLPHLAERAAHDLRGFLARVRYGRPHLTLKLAQTGDGRTAAGTSGYLTGLAARTRVHELRADVDAVLVGSATVRADDPQLDVRHVGEADGRTVRQPRPVVLATRADVDPSARVVRRGALVLVGEDATPASVAGLAERGATVVRVASVPQGDGLDLDAALAALLDHRILTVLAEPGPVLADALLSEGLVDVVELHIAGGVGRGSAVPALARLAPLIDAWTAGGVVLEGSATDIAASLDASTVTVEQLDDDVVLRVARVATVAPVEPASSTASSVRSSHRSAAVAEVA